MESVWFRSAAAKALVVTCRDNLKTELGRQLFDAALDCVFDDCAEQEQRYAYTCECEAGAAGLLCDWTTSTTDTSTTTTATTVTATTLSSTTISSTTSVSSTTSSITTTTTVSSTTSSTTSTTKTDTITSTSGTDTSSTISSTTNTETTSTITTTSGTDTSSTISSTTNTDTSSTVTTTSSTDTSSTISSTTNTDTTSTVTSTSGTDTSTTISTTTITTETITSTSGTDTSSTISTTSGTDTSSTMTATSTSGTDTSTPISSTTNTETTPTITSTSGTDTSSTISSTTNTDTSSTVTTTSSTDTSSTISSTTNTETITSTSGTDTSSTISTTSGTDTSSTMTATSTSGTDTSSTISTTTNTETTLTITSTSGTDTSSTISTTSGTDTSSTMTATSTSGTDTSSTISTTTNTDTTPTITSTSGTDTETSTSATSTTGTFTTGTVTSTSVSTTTGTETSTSVSSTTRTETSTTASSTTGTETSTSVSTAIIVTAEMPTAKTVPGMHSVAAGDDGRHTIFELEAEINREDLEHSASGTTTASSKKERAATASILTIVAVLSLIAILAVRRYRQVTRQREVDLVSPMKITRIGGRQGLSPFQVTGHAGKRPNRYNSMASLGNKGGSGTLAFASAVDKHNPVHDTDASPPKTKFLFSDMVTGAKSKSGSMAMFKSFSQTPHHLRYKPTPAHPASTSGSGHSRGSKHSKDAKVSNDDRLYSMTSPSPAYEMFRSEMTLSAPSLASPVSPASITTPTAAAAVPPESLRSQVMSVSPTAGVWARASNWEIAAAIKCLDQRLIKLQESQIKPEPPFAVSGVVDADFGRFGHRSPRPTLAWSAETTSVGRASPTPLALHPITAAAAKTTSTATSGANRKGRMTPEFLNPALFQEGMADLGYLDDSILDIDKLLEAWQTSPGSVNQTESRRYASGTASITTSTTTATETETGTGIETGNATASAASAGTMTSCTANAGTMTSNGTPASARRWSGLRSESVIDGVKLTPAQGGTYASIATSTDLAASPMAAVQTVDAGTSTPYQFYTPPASIRADGNGTRSVSASPRTPPAYGDGISQTATGSSPLQQASFAATAPHSNSNNSRSGGKSIGSSSRVLARTVRRTPTLRSPRSSNRHAKTPKSALRNVQQRETPTATPYSGSRWSVTSQEASPGTPQSPQTPQTLRREALYRRQMQQELEEHALTGTAQRRARRRALNADAVVVEGEFALSASLRRNSMLSMSNILGGRGGRGGSFDENVKTIRFDLPPKGFDSEDFGKHATVTAASPLPGFVGARGFSA